MKTEGLPKPAILMLPPKPTCGQCEFAEALPNLQFIICRGVPPTPCITGGQQTVRGPEYQVELMSPQMPRTYKGCAFFRQKASEIN